MEFFCLVPNLALKKVLIGFKMTPFFHAWQKKNMCQELRALGYGICIGASDGAFISEVVSPTFFQRRAGIRNAKMNRKIEKSWFPNWRGGRINEH